MKKGFLMLWMVAFAFLAMPVFADVTFDDSVIALSIGAGSGDAVAAIAGSELAYAAYYDSPGTNDQTDMALGGEPCPACTGIVYVLNDSLSNANVAGDKFTSGSWRGSTLLTT